MEVTYKEIGVMSSSTYLTTNERTLSPRALSVFTPSHTLIKSTLNHTSQDGSLYFHPNVWHTPPIAHKNHVHISRKDERVGRENDNNEVW